MRPYGEHMTGVIVNFPPLPPPGAGEDSHQMMDLLLLGRCSRPPVPRKSRYTKIISHR